MVRGEVVQRPGDAIGMQLKRQIAAGQPLAVAELMRPGDGAEGRHRAMLLDSPGIALTAQGKALESGAIGERIRVLNPVVARGGGGGGDRARSGARGAWRDRR